MHNCTKDEECKDTVGVVDGDQMSHKVQDFGKHLNKVEHHFLGRTPRGEHEGAPIWTHSQWTALGKNCSKNNDPPKGQVKMVGASLAWTSDHEWVSFPIIMTHAQEVLSATQEVLTCGLWRVSTLGSRNSHRRWRQQGRGGLATTGISTAWGHQAAPTWWQTAIRRYMPLTHCRKKEGIYIPGSLFSPVDESAAWRADSKRFKRDGSLQQK